MAQSMSRDWDVETKEFFSDFVFVSQRLAVVVHGSVFHLFEACWRRRRRRKCMATQLPTFIILIQFNHLPPFRLNDHTVDEPWIF